MRKLFPDFAENIDPAELYSMARSPHDGQPWVMANMVSSLDGAATSKGKSGMLSTPGDKQIFHLLRGMAEVILVGAGTVRAEGYGPAKGPNTPAIAIVSARLDLDWASPLFTETVTRPYVLTCHQAPEKLRDKASSVADVVVTGDTTVDIKEALQELARRGTKVVLCEGGPTLLGQIVEADLLDELCLAISPVLVGNQGPRILHEMSAQFRKAEPITILEEEGCLFLRYLIGPKES